MAGQIIVVSGTSGAGKSTTCEQYAKQSQDFWLLYGIDHFLAGTYPSKFGHHGPLASSGIQAVPLDSSQPDGPLRWEISDHGWRAFRTLHEWAAAASRQGCNIILDHLAMIDPPLLQDLIWRTEGLPVLFVNLKPPYEVLMERVTQRKMDKKLPDLDTSAREAMRIVVERLNRLRPWFYEAIYANDCHDLEIDTAQHDTPSVCAKIEARLAAGPGTAFEELRRRYPR